MATPGYPRRVAIVGGVRTPFAKAGTVLKDISAIELGKIAVRELLHRTGVEPADVNLLAFGTVIPSVIAPNIAREVALMPQLPKGVQAWSVARACASANQAITDAADQIALGGLSGRTGAFSVSDNGVLAYQAGRQQPGVAREDPAAGPPPGCRRACLARCSLPAPA